MLFIKDLLKHTDHAHPDHAHLEDALEELTILAERVNEAEHQSSLFSLQQEMLITVDGLAEVRGGVGYNHCSPLLPCCSA